MVRTGHNDADTPLCHLMPPICMPITIFSHLHAPPYHAPPRCRHLCQALVTTRAMLPCPSQLHMLSHCASQPYALHCRAPYASLPSAGVFFFFLFFFFC